MSRSPIRDHGLRVLLTLALSIGLQVHVWASEQKPLLRHVQTPAQQQAYLATSTRAEVIRHRTVAPDIVQLVPPAGTIPPAKLSVELFDGASIELTREKLVRRSGQMFTWTGHVGKESKDRAILTIKGNRVQGLLLSGTKLFEIRPLKDVAGTHVLTEIDTNRLKESPNDGLVRKETETPSPRRKPANDEEYDQSPPGEPEGSLAGGNTELAIAADAAAADTPALTSGPIINVLVLFTNQAQSAVTDMELTAQNAIDITNDSDERSGIRQRVHLTAAEAANYNEGTTTMNAQLGQMVDPDDNNMDAVHDLRDRHRADLVALLADDDEWCGWARIMSDVGHDFEDSAFSVTKHTCISGYSFSHEMGHNMGARHDRYMDNTNGEPFDYNHGYVNVDEGWRTVMAYANECTAAGKSCPRNGYWSNPDITYNGEPTGTADNNNARTLNNTAGTVARFRQLGMNESGDAYGARVAVGDFDGDGLMDLAIGAPGESPGSDPKSGWVFVYKGTPYGLTSWTSFGQRTLGVNENGDLFGQSLAAGDFDGDGIDDLAVGAPGESPGSKPRSGWVFLFKGSAQGLSPWKGFGQAGIGDDEQGDEFGTALAAGDFDGDGKDDLAVSAPGESPGADPRSGYVFIFKGTSGAGLSAWSGFGQAGLGANENGDRFGHALAAGDFDGDGKDDLAVGAPGESPARTRSRATSSYSKEAPRGSAPGMDLGKLAWARTRPAICSGMHLLQGISMATAGTISPLEHPGKRPPPTRDPATSSCSKELGVRGSASGQDSGRADWVRTRPATSSVMRSLQGISMAMAGTIWPSERPASRPGPTRSPDTFSFSKARPARRSTSGTDSANVA